MCGRVVFRSDVLALSVLIGGLDGEYCASKTLLGTLVDLFEVKLEREIGDGVLDRLAPALDDIRVVGVLEFDGIRVTAHGVLRGVVTDNSVLVELGLVEDNDLGVRINAEGTSTVSGGRLQTLFTVVVDSKVDGKILILEANRIRTRANLGIGVIVQGIHLD